MAPIDSCNTDCTARMTNAGLCLVDRQHNTRNCRAFDRYRHCAKQCTGCGRYADKGGFLVESRHDVLPLMAFETLDAMMVSFSDADQFIQKGPERWDVCLNPAPIQKLVH